MRAVSTALSLGAIAALMPGTPASTLLFRGFVNGSMELYLAFMEGASSIRLQCYPSTPLIELETASKHANMNTVAIFFYLKH